ncbi:MAG: glycosyltransferase [Candidatus Omnitrophica bacterium]|nr:glycosyltransferase [Candidatus Omnitrophota bacterium]
MRPLLSIVTPTRGELDDEWLKALLSVKGHIEFVIVYPPDTQFSLLTDPRVRQITSPYKGEVAQRALGLLETRGRYVLALDDDDFIHPDIADLVERYWAKYPDAWVLRLRKTGSGGGDSWPALPDLSGVVVKERDGGAVEEGKEKIYAVPVVPFRRPLDWKMILMPFIYRRTDHGGWHMENFVDRIWRADMARAAVRDFFEATHLAGPFKYVPPVCSFGFDRVICLFLQARFYEEGRVIGYWMPMGPEQIRKTGKEQRLKPRRFHVLSHVLLVKHYPRYPYLWNLFLEKLYDTPKALVKTMITGIKNRRTNGHKR